MHAGLAVGVACLRASCSHWPVRAGGSCSHWPVRAGGSCSHWPVRAGGWSHQLLPPQMVQLTVMLTVSQSSSRPLVLSCSDRSSAQQYIFYIFSKTQFTRIHPSAHCSIITARTWEQPECPSTEEWVSKTWQTHTVEHTAQPRKERDHAFCGNANGPGEYPAKRRKSDRERQMYHLHEESKKMMQMKLFTK